MDGATAPAKRPKLNPHGKALRRERIFERLRGGWSYEAIASEEQVTPRRVRQIVTEVLRRREVDDGPDQAMLQLFRLESAHRLGAEALASGDVRAIGPYLAVLERLDRYRRGAAPRAGLRQDGARPAVRQAEPGRQPSAREVEAKAAGRRRALSPRSTGPRRGATGRFPWNSPASH